VEVEAVCCAPEVVTMAGRAASAVDALNEVVLHGTVRHDPEERELPSGDALVTLRLVVPRADTAEDGTRRSDWVDCAVWARRLQHRVVRWRAGDQVEVRGALRRRFYRYGVTGEKGTRLEVEVRGGRVLRRGPDAAES
jgi:single-strand DNA-binding protein